MEGTSGKDLEMGSFADDKRSDGGKRIVLDQPHLQHTPEEDRKSYPLKKRFLKPGKGLATPTQDQLLAKPPPLPPQHHVYPSAGLAIASQIHPESDVQRWDRFTTMESAKLGHPKLAPTNLKPSGIVETPANLLNPQAEEQQSSDFLKGYRIPKHQRPGPDSAIEVKKEFMSEGFPVGTAPKLQASSGSTSGQTIGKRGDIHELGKESIGITQSGSIHVPAPTDKTLPPLSSTLAKRQRTGHATGTDTSQPTRYSMILETKFRGCGGDPKTADIAELVCETGLSTQQIRNWFKQHVNSSNQDPTTGEHEGLDSSNGIERTSPADATSSSGKKKYIRFVWERTADLETIKADLGNVEAVPVETIKGILRTVWTRKAKHIHDLVRSNKDFGGQPISNVVYMEGRRALDLVRYDPFTDQQTHEINAWKTGFREWMKTQAPVGEGDSTLDLFFNDYINPWITPFVYSKVTQQGDRFLSLEVALDDFRKLRMHPKSFQWVTLLPAWYTEQPNLR